MLSMLMTECRDESKILHLAATSVPSFGGCRTVGVHLGDRGWSTALPIANPTVRAGLEDQIPSLGRSGGPVAIAGSGWSWAFPLRGLDVHMGYVFVVADDEPGLHEQFLLRVLAQQTGVALANAHLLVKERATAEELRASNEALAETVQALEHTTEIHKRFTRVAVAGEGLDGIALTLHEVTGIPVAVEDQYGNLRAWAGPNRPQPYPKDPPARREQMLRRALRERRPIREGGRLLAVANPRADVVGVLALVDPAGEAGEREKIALEYATTVLAMELARLRSLAETELRLRRDLVEELLAGTDEESALARAQALGYDLERRHRVVVVEGRGRTQDEDTFFHAVRRCVRAHNVGSLLVSRGGAVVVLSDAEPDWERLRSAVLTELGGGRCRVGVGGWCERPSDYPRSYREAQLALTLQDSVRAEDRVTCYDDLGVYRIFCEVKEPAALERFVRQWLGTLLDYDTCKHSELVATLGCYLECGGNYDCTAAMLCVHRSTLKYRLQRIREISGHDLAHPGIRFNLQLATRAWQTLQTLQTSRTQTLSGHSVSSRPRTAPLR
ncbi:CdaR family transcriptional regulator [Mycobacterium sp. SM1]|uniref:PucR family transcriptional regulator n=1 Tax=Mycobacterium sp. SM1 TaxID=2816243 RepID=UPI001F1A8D00|nr:helix-turn-helix domain-containing protein [Mycobacterium sp. SM1]